MFIEIGPQNSKLQRSGISSPDGGPPLVRSQHSTDGAEQLTQRGVQQAGGGGLGRGEPGFQCIAQRHQFLHLRYNPVLLGKRGNGNRATPQFRCID